MKCNDQALFYKNKFTRPRSQGGRGIEADNYDGPSLTIYPVAPKKDRCIQKIVDFLQQVVGGCDEIVLEDSAGNKDVYEQTQASEKRERKAWQLKKIFGYEKDWQKSEFQRNRRATICEACGEEPKMSEYETQEGYSAARRVYAEKIYEAKKMYYTTPDELAEIDGCQGDV